MKHSQNSGEVHNLVQARPAFAAQSFDHLVGRGDRKRNHDEKAGHADGDERPLGYVRNRAPEIKEPIKPDVRDEME